MHTEKEAREKWCPFARGSAFESQTGASESAATLNRDGNGAPYHECMCIASDCMAWRWADARYQYQEDREVVEEDAGSSVTVETVTTTAQENLNRRGYCGLAGAPEATR